MATETPESAPEVGRALLFPRPGSVTGWLLLPLTWASIVLIRFYQLVISPAIPPSCRFEPSCSQYALQAVQRHGAIKGWFLGVRRLARCHPWNRGGFDPVP